MLEKNDRRSFLRNLSISGLGFTVVPNSILRSEPVITEQPIAQQAQVHSTSQQRKYNGSYNR
jgi:hypothetical protein